jgi:hypothetical protein
MNATTATSPLKEDESTKRSDVTSGSRKLGNAVPSGSMVDGVTATRSLLSSALFV